MRGKGHGSVVARGWERGEGWLQRRVRKYFGATLLCLHCGGGYTIVHLEMYTKKSGFNCM